MKHKAVYHISDYCVVITLYSTMYYNSMYTVQYNVIVNCTEAVSNRKQMPIANHSIHKNMNMDVFAHCLLILASFIGFYCCAMHKTTRPAQIDCNKALHTQKVKPGSSITFKQRLLTYKHQNY